MTTLIFLLMGGAMIVAIGGRRGTAIGLFGVSLVLAVLWLHHHMDSVLNLAL
jgi:hypothetical protein